MEATFIFLLDEGILVVVHYWFYVRGTENLCKLREEMVESKIKVGPCFIKRAIHHFFMQYDCLSFPYPLFCRSIFLNS